MTHAENHPKRERETGPDKAQVAAFVEDAAAFFAAHKEGLKFLGYGKVDELPAMAKTGALKPHELATIFEGDIDARPDLR